MATIPGSEFAPPTGTAFLPTPFDVWAQGVLQGIEAPVTPQNIAFLAAWARFESGPDVLRWNNPLNTTQGPGVDKNSVGVKAFPDIPTGIARTVQTLENGHYPHILTGLRTSQAPAWYAANASGDLGTWGSGTSWIGNASNLAAEVLQTNPVPSGAAGTASAAVAATDPVTAGFASIVTQTGGILHRVGLFILGLMLIGIGLFLLFRPSSAPVPSPGSVAKLAAI